MEQDRTEFVQMLTASQPLLYACILSLLPDRTAANDVLQETNLCIWNQAGSFKLGTNFAAWASQIARFQVQNHRRKSRRDRLVFDESVFDELCQEQSKRMEQVAVKAEKLRECLGKLTEEQRSLLEDRYAKDVSVAQVAQSRARTANAISQKLHRIRELLFQCVSQKLQRGSL